MIKTIRDICDSAEQTASVNFFFHEKEYYGHVMLEMLGIIRRFLFKEVNLPFLYEETFCCDKTILN